MHVYGYEHLLTFFNLGRGGLLIEDAAGSNSRNFLASATLGMLYKKDSFKVNNHKCFSKPLSFSLGELVI